MGHSKWDDRGSPVCLAHLLYVGICPSSPFSRESRMRILLTLGLLASSSVLAQDISLGSTMLSAAQYSEGGTSLGYIDQPVSSTAQLAYGPASPSLPNGPSWPVAPVQPIAPVAQIPMLPAAAADPLNPQSPADPQSPLAVHLLVQTSQSSGSTVPAETAMPPAQKSANIMSVKTFDSLQNVASNVTNLVKLATTVNSGQ